MMILELFGDLTLSGVSISGYRFSLFRPDLVFYFEFKNLNLEYCSRSKVYTKASSVLSNAFSQKASSNFPFTIVDYLHFLNALASLFAYNKSVLFEHIVYFP